MKIEIEKIKKDLAAQPFVDKIVTFLLYGSAVNNVSRERTIHDTDICIVLKDRETDLRIIADFLFDHFKEPDYTIYYKDEIDSSLPFRDRGVGWFAIEFFANGVLICGENIFQDKLKALNLADYRLSHLEKIFEYTLRIRNKYTDRNLNHNEKLRYMNKYVTRLLREILLFNGFSTYMTLENMEKNEIFDLGKNKNIIADDSEVNFFDIESLFKVFNEISLYSIKLGMNK